MALTKAYDAVVDCFMPYGKEQVTSIAVLKTMMNVQNIHTLSRICPKRNYLRATHAQDVNQNDVNRCARQRKAFTTELRALLERLHAQTMRSSKKTHTILVDATEDGYKKDAHSVLLIMRMELNNQTSTVSVASKVGSGRRTNAGRLRLGLVDPHGHKRTGFPTWFIDAEDLFQLTTTAFCRERSLVLSVHPLLVSPTKYKGIQGRMKGGFCVAYNFFNIYTAVTQFNSNPRHVVSPFVNGRSLAAIDLPYKPAFEANARSPKGQGGPSSPREVHGMVNMMDDWEKDPSTRVPSPVVSQSRPVTRPETKPKTQPKPIGPHEVCSLVIFLRRQIRMAVGPYGSKRQKRLWPTYPYLKSDGSTRVNAVVAMLLFTVDFVKACAATRIQVDVKKRAAISAKRAMVDVRLRQRGHRSRKSLPGVDRLAMRMPLYKTDPVLVQHAIQMILKLPERVKAAKSGTKSGNKSGNKSDSSGMNTNDSNRAGSSSPQPRHASRPFFRAAMIRRYVLELIRTFKRHLDGQHVRAPEFRHADELTIQEQLVFFVARTIALHSNAVSPLLTPSERDRIGQTVSILPRQPGTTHVQHHFIFHTRGSAARHVASLIAAFWDTRKEITIVTPHSWQRTWIAFFEQIVDVLAARFPEYFAPGTDMNTANTRGHIGTQVSQRLWKSMMRYASPPRNIHNVPSSNHGARHNQPPTVFHTYHALAKALGLNGAGRSAGAHLSLRPLHLLRPLHDTVVICVEADEVLAMQHDQQNPSSNGLDRLRPVLLQQRNTASPAHASAGDILTMIPTHVAFMTSHPSPMTSPVGVTLQDCVLSDDCNALFSLGKRKERGSELGSERSYAKNAAAMDVASMEVGAFAYDCGVFEPAHGRCISDMVGQKTKDHIVRIYNKPGLIPPRAHVKRPLKRARNQ